MGNSEPLSVPYGVLPVRLLSPTPITLVAELAMDEITKNDSTGHKSPLWVAANSHSSLIAASVPIVAALDYVAGTAFLNGYLQGLGVGGAISPPLYTVLYLGALPLLLVAVALILISSVARLIIFFVLMIMPKRMRSTIESIFRRPADSTNGSLLRTVFIPMTVTFGLTYIGLQMLGQEYGKRRVASDCTQCEATFFTSQGVFKGRPLIRDDTRLALFERDGSIRLIPWSDVQRLKRSDMPITLQPAGRMPLHK